VFSGSGTKPVHFVDFISRLCTCYCSVLTTQIYMANGTLSETMMKQLTVATSCRPAVLACAAGGQRFLWFRQQGCKSVRPFTAGPR